MTIKGHLFEDTGSQEHTLRPTPRKVVDKPPSPKKGHQRSKSSTSKLATPGSSRPRSPTKVHFNKFELPSRPDLLYREQSIEDYSDLLVDDNVFEDRVSRAVEKVINKSPHSTHIKF